MTNELTAQALQYAGSTNGQELIRIVFDGGPVWPHILGLAWMLLIPFAPIISLIACYRAWRHRNESHFVARAARVIYACALTVLTTSIIHALAGVYRALFSLGTTAVGAAQQAMLMMNLNYECLFMAIGICSCFVCLLCALCLPLKRS